jgi:serine/threonine protein kinase/WD40 repeat protein
MREIPREPDDRLDELLLAWEEAASAGHPVSEAQLCRDCPELASDLAREIARLHAIDRFLFPEAGCDNVPARAAPIGIGISPVPDLPGYEVLEELGRGGMGVVFKARQRSLGRIVAVKTLGGSRWGQSGFADRLRHEAQALSRLNHPNIVQVIDVMETPQGLFIVLEYVDGESLSRRQRGLPLPPKEAAVMARTIAQALAVVHRQELLHRDIKPANLLITRTGELKISDFGLAKEAGSAGELTMTGEILGSPGYMAPEQAEGRTNEVDVRTDVYAVGATLYEMLTGRTPFVGRSIVETLDQVRQRAPVAPSVLQPGIPRDLESICLKCLEKRPAARYGTAALLAGDLERFLSGQPTLARPLSPAARGLRWVKRHPARTAVLSIAFLAVVIVVCVSTWSIVQISSARRETAIKHQALEAGQQSLRAHQEKNRFQELSLLTARIRERSRDRPRGWVVQNLADIGRAARNADGDETRRTLRREAVQALCAVELLLAGTFVENFNTFGLVYSPDGRILAAGENGPAPTAEVVLFDTETRAETRRLVVAAPPRKGDRNQPGEGVRSLLFTPDGTRLCVGTRMGMIHIWNIAAGSHERSWQAHTKFVNALGLLPEQDVLASLSGDHQLRFWNFADGGRLQEFQFVEGSGASLVVNGERIYIGADDQLCEFHIDPRTRTVESDRRIPWPKQGLPVQLALMGDQRTLFGLGREMPDLIAVDLESGEPHRKLFDPRHEFVHEGTAHALDISPDRRWLLSTAGDGLKLWDLLSGDVATTIVNSDNRRVSAMFHPRRPELVLSRDGRIEVWRISETDVWDSELRQSYPVETMDLSGDGKTLAGTIDVGSHHQYSGRRNSAHIVDIDRQGKFRHWTTDTVHNYGIGLSNRAKFLMCSNLPSDSRGSIYLRLFDLEDGARSYSETPRMFRFGKPVFSANEERLWYAGLTLAERVGFLAAVNTKDGHEEIRWLNDHSERTLRRSQILSVAVGQTLVAASSIDGTVRMFHSGNGQLLRETVIPEQIVDAVCLPGDEQWLLGGTRQGQLLAISTADGRIGFQAPVHQEAITAITGAANGLAFTGCHDGTLAAWWLLDGRPEELFRMGPLKRRINDLVLSRDGTLLAVLVEGETGVRMLRINALRQQFAELGLNWP